MLSETISFCCRSNYTDTRASLGRWLAGCPSEPVAIGTCFPDEAKDSSLLLLISVLQLCAIGNLCHGMPYMQAAFDEVKAAYVTLAFAFYDSGLILTR